MGWLSDSGIWTKKMMAPVRVGSVFLSIWTKKMGAGSALQGRGGALAIAFSARRSMLRRQRRGMVASIAMIGRE